jgi:hypothetical protein
MPGEQEPIPFARPFDVPIVSPGEDPASLLARAEALEVASKDVTDLGLQAHMAEESVKLRIMAQQQINPEQII